MTLTERFTKIVQEELQEDIIPFLQALTPAERATLVPLTKEYNKYYGEIVELKSGHYGGRGSMPQHHILAIASFVCLDMKTFDKSFYAAHIMNRQMLDELLPWYQPSWFTTFLNEYNEGTKITHMFDYDLMMFLATEGYFVPGPVLIARLLPRYIYGSDPDDKKVNLYTPEKLFVYPATLEQHFWYLFEYNSTVHITDKWTTYKNLTKGESGWKILIKEFTQQGRIDRTRVLKECLLVANRNFNKLEVAWFMDLFTEMSPSKEELLELQPVLMSVLNAPHSKAVNTALDQLKKLTEEKSFDYVTFMEHFTQVILSGVKSSTVTAMLIVEKICRQYEAVREQASIALCQVFLSKDESVQLKAAKLISTYGNMASVDLQEQLKLFGDAMLTNTRTALGSATMTTNDEWESTSILLISAHHLIPSVDTVEDLVYLASQAFENNASYHVDLLPAALINLQSKITSDIIEQLAPAFQRAYNLYTKPSGNLGGLDYMLMLFFLNYGKLLGRKQGEVRDFQDWQLYNTETPIFEPYKILLQAALNKLAAKDPLPLLSTPTHTPGWIDPVVLMQRLHQYQEKNVTPDHMDLQIAVSRCALQETTVDKLSGEYKNLMLFLLNKSAQPEGPFTLPAAWMQAAITKTPGGIYPAFKDFSYSKLPVVYLTGNFEWSTVEEPYLAYGAYNAQTREPDRFEDIRKSLHIHFPSKDGAELILKGNAPLLQEYIAGVTKYLTVTSADVKRLLSLTPSNPSILLARILHYNMTSSAQYEVTESNGVAAAIAALKEFDVERSETATLFIATCMLNGSKTTRSFAAECWIAGVADHKINSAALGQVIGIHERIEWAPLKRFTDLVSGNMIQISKQHNNALETMLTSIIELLPDKPVKDLKKLLEIYFEVLSLNVHQISNPVVTDRLAVWKSSATVKKIVGDLQKLVSKPNTSL